MFNQEFFPTPAMVVIDMCQGIVFRNKKVLEPSAGKGDIADYVKEKGGDCYCIEQQHELQDILRGKNHVLIDTDFLKYEVDHLFDYIIMNPPFSMVTEHLTKALDIGNGAEIRCLIPSGLTESSIKKNKALMERLYALGADFKELGNCFRISERSTDVRVTLVSVVSEVVDEHFNFNDLNFQTEDRVDFGEAPGELVSSDSLEKLFNIYDASTTTFLEIIKLQKKIESYLGNIPTGSYGFNTGELIKKSIDRSPATAYNAFNRQLKRDMWHLIFNKLSLEGKLTSNVQEEFVKYLSRVENLAFNRHNIRIFVDELLTNRNTMFEKCIEQSFDIITKHYADNRTFVEGWKTNSMWKVNKKFILPYAIDSFYAQNYNEIFIELHFREKLDDIEKSLANIEGVDFKNIKKVSDFQERKDELKFGKWYESRYFKFKFFKKGTGHFVFKDLILLEKFNQIACKSKNWLGE